LKDYKPKATYAVFARPTMQKLHGIFDRPIIASWVQFVASFKNNN